jgi:hypothetical protein
MKHVKLFEQFVNESNEEQIAKEIIQDLLGEYDPWEFADMQPEEAEETVASYGHKGAKAKKIAAALLDLAQSGQFESKVFEYSREDFTTKPIDRKNAVKPNVLAKILFRASKTSKEAEERILSFNGTAMATHSAYYIVKPNGNKPDRPTYRIHVEQYYKWRPNDPKVNVSHVLILKLKEGSNAFTSQGDEWDVVGRAYVDTDMLTDDLNRTLEVLQRVS